MIVHVWAGELQLVFLLKDACGVCVRACMHACICECACVSVRACMCVCVQKENS